MEQRIDNKWIEHSYFECILGLIILGLGSIYAIYTVRLNQIDLAFVNEYYQMGYITSLATYLFSYGVSNIKKVLIIWLLGCTWWLAPLGILIGAGYLFAYSYAITLLMMVFKMNLDISVMFVLIIEAILISTYYLRSMYVLRICIISHFNKQIGYKESRNRYRSLIEGIRVCVGMVLIEYFRLFV